MGGVSVSRLELRQVHGQVVGEPAVAGPEGLGFGRLSVPHDPEPVLVGVDALLEFSSSQGWSTPRESGSFCLNPVTAETVERVRAARFSAANSLDTFDFPAIPSVNKALVMELARCEYIQRRENVIAVGNSGAGKTHIALGLGLAACQRGMPVGFTAAADLVHELMEARDERRLLNLQRQVARLRLLIVDELGFVPLSRTGAELLFEVFR